jgi:hypothetical protein
MFGRQLLDEGGVSIGIGAAEPVMKMNDRENAAEFDAKLNQCAQKGCRVGTSGNSDSNTVAGAD